MRVSLDVLSGRSKKSNTGKKKNMPVSVTNTVTISLINALPNFSRLTCPSWTALKMSMWLKKGQSG